MNHSKQSIIIEAQRRGVRLSPAEFDALLDAITERASQPRAAVVIEIPHQQLAARRYPPPGATATRAAAADRRAHPRPTTGSWFEIHPTPPYRSLGVLGLPEYWANDGPAST